MSIRIMSRIWEDAPYSGTVLLMFLAIADHANDDGVAYPGNRHLAKKCRVSKRRAQQIIQQLLDDGVITAPDVGGGRGNKRVIQVSPFYLPGGRKGETQRTKGEIQGVKGEAGDAPTYSESVNQLTKEVSETEHQKLRQRLQETIWAPHEGSRVKDYVVNAKLLSKEGDVIELEFESPEQAAYVEARFKTLGERSLLGIANRPMEIEFYGQGER